MPSVCDSITITVSMVSCLVQTYCSHFFLSHPCATYHAGRTGHAYATFAAWPYIYSMDTWTGRMAGQGFVACWHSGEREQWCEEHIVKYF